MGFFRKANPDEIVRVTTPDGEDWIDLYGEFSKEQVNKVVLAAPRGSDDVQGSLSFVERFFEIAVKDWSMTDDKGDKVKPTVKVYRDLANEPAKWIDGVLVEHLQKTIGQQVDELEGKPSE